MEVLLYTVLTLCVLGILAALILYFVAQKFKVEEDPRIDEVEKMLPGANCGGCGFAGCRGLADALVKRTDISSLFCPVGGAEVMKTVAAYLGKAAPEKEPQVATVRCGGSCEKRPRINAYDGVTSCAVAASLYGGETGCTYGCLGYGDCVTVCNFDAIAINPETRLPEVDFDKCTACGACVKACPKSIIELRKKWPKQRAVYVACMSKDKGAVVMKACKAGCIGCGKCEKVCPFGAITDRSFILDVVRMLKGSQKNQNYKMIAIVAPSISSQFTYAKLGQVIAGIHLLGFSEIVEAALGADMVSYKESEELAEKGFLLSSCCPAFVKYVQIQFPMMADKISENLSPMATIAKYIKEQRDPDAKIVFIGPCTSKKMEFQKDCLLYTSDAADE